MTKTIVAILIAASLPLAACDVAGTAVRTTGEAAGETTKAAGDVAGTAAHGVGRAVESTTEKAGDAVGR